jgi:hypothetical protein
MFIGFTLCVATLMLLFPINSQELFEVAVMDIAAVFAATHRFLASLSKNTGQF